MDIVTLGAALNGSAEYVNSHFVEGTNIQIVDNPDGTQTINASGEVSAEDAVARAEIAAIKDGETIDSFGDVETALATKADSSTTYTKTEVDTALGNKADKSTTYTKTEVDTALSAKADKSTTYTKTEVDTALADKVDKETGRGLSTNDYTTAEKTKLAGIAEGAEVNVQSNWTQTTTTADDYIKNKPTLGTAAAKNATDTYNATGTDVTTGKAVAAALATLPEPMVFKGSLGTGGTIATLPTASSSNKGYVYKVITAGTYASQSAKAGDTFISDGSAWVLIPSGDEPSGTVTNVAVANGGGLTVSGSPITSSGTITVGHSNSVTAKTSSSLKKFTYDAYGHVTGSSELSTAESDALASGIDSTKVEQIEINKNNISYLENTGKKNWLKPDTISGVPTGITIQYESDDSITINGTYSGADYAYVFLHSFTHEAMQYTLSCSVETMASKYYFYTRDGHMQTTQTLTYTYSDSDTTRIVMRITPNTTFNNVNVQLMIRPSIITDSTYQPYAMSNAELTAKEQANENNILLLTQYGGGRNVLSVSAATIYTGSLDIETIPAGTYKFHCDTDAPSNWALKFRNASNTDVYVVESSGSMSPNSAITVTLTEDVVKISPWWSGSSSGLTNMYLCRESDWTTPYVYQPYALSNAELTALVLKVASVTYSLNDLTWTASLDGMIYSNTTVVNGITSIYSAIITGFARLRATDVIIPILSNDGTQIRFMANTGSWVTDAEIKLRIVGI